LQRFQEDHEDDLAVGAEDEDGEAAEAEKNDVSDEGNSSSSERDAVIFFLICLLRALFQSSYQPPPISNYKGVMLCDRPVNKAAGGKAPQATSSGQQMPFNCRCVCDYLL
jgi:hypothetical protein